MPTVGWARPSSGTIVASTALEGLRSGERETGPRSPLTTDGRWWTFGGKTIGAQPHGRYRCRAAWRLTPKALAISGQSAPRRRSCRTSSSTAAAAPSRADTRSRRCSSSVDTTSFCRRRAFCLRGLGGRATTTAAGLSGVSAADWAGATGLASTSVALPLGHRAEVEEPEVDLLLDLVGALTEQEHHRTVRLLDGGPARPDTDLVRGHAGRGHGNLP